MSGKPSVRGTRLTVEFLLKLFAAGWSQEQVLQAYPQLTVGDLAAVFANAADCVEDQRLFMLRADVA
jgi:uncharacterized protein (DUF433 family)